MYFPDSFAGLTALSGRVRRFVLRWRTRDRAVAPQTAGTLTEPGSTDPLGSGRLNWPSRWFARGWGGGQGRERRVRRLSACVQAFLW